MLILIDLIIRVDWWNVGYYNSLINMGHHPEIRDQSAVNVSTQGDHYTSVQNLSKDDGYIAFARSCSGVNLDG